MVQKLSDLRAPPVVGRFYLVPAVEYIWHERKDWWPVAGPLHSDAEHFNFEYPHYHVDPRFLTAAQEAHALRGRRGAWWAAPGEDETIEQIVGRWPLFRRGEPLPKGRPVLIRRKCRRAEREPYAYSDRKPVKGINRQYRGRKAGAEPIRLADGRILCPHRKYDLSQHTPDKHGYVVCPLHGLKVRCHAR